MRARVSFRIGHFFLRCQPRHGMDRSQLRDSLLAARRPSLTPSESPELEVSRSRRRSRQREEQLHAPLSFGDWASGGAPPAAKVKQRRFSHGQLQSESMHRARKPRMEAEPSPEFVKPALATAGLPESPEGAKGLTSSWEINVKDLVGDAVGNVRDFLSKLSVYAQRLQMSISPNSRDIVLAAYVSRLP